MNLHLIHIPTLECLTDVPLHPLTIFSIFFHPGHSYSYSTSPPSPTPPFLLLFITPFLFQSPRLLRFEEFSTPSSPPFIPTPLLLDNQEYVSKISLFLCQNNSPNT